MTQRPKVGSRRTMAYDAGRRGGPMPDWVDETSIDDYDRGFAEYTAVDEGTAGTTTTPLADPPPRPRKAPAARRTSRRPSTRDTTPPPADEVRTPARFREAASTAVGVDDAAGFLLGLLAVVLGLNYLRGGAAQARGWIAAKFINEPYAGGTGPIPFPPGHPAPDAWDDVTTHTTALALPVAAAQLQAVSSG